MEQWELPELRPFVGHQLPPPSGNPFPEHSGLTPTSTPTPANSARSGNGISTPTRTTAVIFKPWSHYTLDSVKKRYKAMERELNDNLVDVERENKWYAERIEELKQSHKYLASLKELKRKVNEAYERRGRLIEEQHNWKRLVESLQSESVDDGAKMASEDSESPAEDDSENESEHESQNESDYDFNDGSEEESEGDSEDEIGKGIGEDDEV
ncbi:hypothetical protein NEUTE1DRAFT_111675 [Neurospora tetrasperma FGSC 2508]|uniref:Uncharacterized protein n=1 Tax=Neurospora tetrasperma (strain FGSC 2508 / ATCC MYA-4615 / P0657) TaxID=510951 RepID=F8MSM2_NEUT8|nr:uncharacterized protein NEUTE1DRAFT_111675 [Neurospora tetrasperma FGSC 2508]EGO55109.1 hypothetical protein NEUTE1DRAFT_111675 [Neurospora tetrasperma FGSC 2508]